MSSRMEEFCCEKTNSARELGYICDHTTQSDTRGEFVCLRHLPLELKSRQSKSAHASSQ